MREREWGSPNWDEGDRHCGTLGIYVLFGLSSFTYLPNSVLNSSTVRTEDVNILSYKPIDGTYTHVA